MTAATKPPRVTRPEPELEEPPPFRPTPEQRDDHRWADTDPEVQKKYAGQMIVPFRKQVIGHGELSDEAIDQARAYLASIGLAGQEIFVVQIIDPDDLLRR